jgi:NAD(P)-dependent dehydrogenase (short-subunit alcohol dehydrogenase family)
MEPDVAEGHRQPDGLGMVSRSLLGVLARLLSGLEVNPRRSGYRSNQPPSESTRRGSGGVEMGVWLLVIGARKGSLGEAIAQHVDEHPFSTVMTAGISGEQVDLDLGMPESRMAGILADLDPQHIVCTAGVNLMAGVQDIGYMGRFSNSLLNNVQHPMKLLSVWLIVHPPSDTYRSALNHFVAISSNSAHIARRNSGPYCASKAALSMAIRCAGRELADSQFVTYAYEPGLLDGTPMTSETRMAFPQGALHRMPGYAPRAGLSARSLARMVVGNLNAGKELNGCTLRVDAGEQ